MSHYGHIQARLILLLIGVVSVVAAVPGKDRVRVTFTHDVSINNHVLPPGMYTIQEMSGKTNDNILEIRGDKGQSFETSVSTLDTVDKQVPNETKVILKRVNGTYYLDKIWIQGRVRGYQVLLPDQIRKATEDGQPEEVSGTLEAR
jgi:hypothetical protein